MTQRVARSFLLLLICCSVVGVAQVTSDRVRVSEGFLQGLLIKKVDPVYPLLARQAHIQGTVVLQAVISKTGDVASVQVISGHPMLVAAAIEAAKQWKYRPYELNGVPVEVETTMRVNFTLSSKPPEGVEGSVPGGIPEGQPGGIVDADEASSSSASSVPQRIRVASRVEEQLRVSKVNPVYPADAKDQHIEGIVVLKVIVDQAGSVSQVELVSGHPLLATAAIEAVKQWKYQPYLLNQKPVEVETLVQVSFTLKS